MRSGSSKNLKKKIWELSSAVDVSLLSEVQRSCVSHGGFVAGAAHFDAASFGVSPAEAAAMTRILPTSQKGDWRNLALTQVHQKNRRGSHHILPPRKRKSAEGGC